MSIQDPAATRKAIKQPPRQSPRRAALGAGLGVVIEYYDWAVYALFAPFFATQLFNPADPTSALLATFAVFAVGFLARPIGGFVFGRISDSVGRKTTMAIAIGLAALGSLAIGLAPTYAAVGVWSSVLLVAARLLQGLAHGGEAPSAQTYISEVAPRQRRGLWSSFIYIAVTVGVMFGTLLGAVLSGVLTTDQMSSFGWRIPFVIGGLLGLYGLVMRARMPESEAFEGSRDDHAVATAQPSFWSSIVQHRKQALQVFGITVGFTVTYYVWAVFAPSYATTSLNIGAGDALWAGTIANIAFLVALPLWGRLSDRIGRKPVMLIGILGAAALHFPMTWFIKDAAWQLAVSMTVMLVALAAMASIVSAAYAELFPTSIRTTGVAVPYAICVALFGGTAPYLQSLFTNVLGLPWIFSLYAVVLLLISAIVIRYLPETKGKDLHY
jgi:MHS family alpha-ketoglutarate permease-like MFS transporter